MQQLRAKLKDMKEGAERAEGGVSFPEVGLFEFRMDPKVLAALDELLKIVNECFRMVGEALRKAFGWEPPSIQLPRLIERALYKPSWRDVAPQRVGMSPGFVPVHRRPHARGRW